MEYIKVLAIDSTNSELKRRYRNNVSLPNLCLSTDDQVSGRGQRNNAWHTEKGKNLTFSLLLNNLSLPIAEAFKVSALVSLAITDYLQERFSEESFFVKWPNDIMAGQQKLTGILIENMIRGPKIKASIIGIGLNVNQVEFDGLPSATSLKKIHQKDLDLSQLLIDLSTKIEASVYRHLQTPLTEVLQAYNQQLFRKNVPSLFQFPDQSQSEGLIQEVLPNGNLSILFASGLREFRFKEIKLIY